MQNSTTSIHHLPAELLAEIFLWLVTSLSVERGYKNPLITLDRVVSLVCKRWRTIAHGEPRLWVSILPPHRVHDALALDAFVRRYLPRSGSLPLRLASGVSGPRSAPPDVLLPFISALSPYASRWESLTMRGTCTLFSEIRPVATPLLRAALFHVDWAGEREQCLSLQFLADAPQLGFLEVRCPNMRPLKVSFPPLENLTLLMFGVHNYSLPALFESLRPCRQTLSELSIAIRDPQLPMSEPAGGHIIFPSLWNLTLKGSGSWPVLQLITPPALEVLKMEFPLPDTPDVLLDFLTRVPAAAISLQMVVLFTPIDHGILLQCLARTPNLVSLSLGSCPASRPLLQGLTIRDPNDPGMLVPRLEFMACDYVGDLGALVEFFEGRSWPRTLRDGTRIGTRIMLPPKVMDVSFLGYRRRG
ncbi:hypothetical protein GGG16DRAFT_67636 [Schizophyllum commune]|nr:hypothetical protein K525DRAFT_214183 [Schizophyllum commune Loenen D]